MTVIDTLLENGVSAEDLEKAASARLFVNACAEEGIDLSAHSDEDVENAYDAFVTENFGGGEQPVEKTASADEVEEAHAKLAEAEILGRHMARAFQDEMGKTAADKKEPTKHPVGKSVGVGAGLGAAAGGALGAGVGGAGAALGAHKINKLLSTPDGQKVVRELVGNRAFFKMDKGISKTKAGLAGAAALGLAGAGSGAIRGVTHGLAHGLGRRQGRKDKEASAPAFDELAVQRANEILAENGITDEPEADQLAEAVEARAVEMLQEAGYEFQE